VTQESVSEPPSEPALHVRAFSCLRFEVVNGPYWHKAASLMLPSLDRSDTLAPRIPAN
jgi:hypothetical protein